MDVNRKTFQGVGNILRFNWHFYVLALGSILLLLLVAGLTDHYFRNLLVAGALLGMSTIIISLLVSFYIYDLSDLYKINWLNVKDHAEILNINAGFDETSEIIRGKYPNARLISCDFYNPEKHTEVSIRRARKAYPQPNRTIQVQTTRLPFEHDRFDNAMAILSAHEIREETERITFFKELGRVTKTSGQIIVTEHLRDVNNFMAYTVGFFHFHSKDTWMRTFTQAGLIVKNEIRITPFITTFILEKNGNTL